MGLPKRYETLARLGATSTTGDPEGELRSPAGVPQIAGPADRRAAPRPPAYSAVKVGGGGPTAGRGAARASRCPSES